MKKILIFLPGIAFLALVPVKRADAALAIYWALDETSGTLASDSSGNGVAGNWQGTVGSPGWSPAGGVSGGAVAFTGANLDSFITSSFAGVTGTPFSISLWVNTSSSLNNGLAYLGNGATGTSYNVVRVNGTVARAGSRNTTERTASGTTVINDGQWHHLVGVFSGTTLRQIYVDGVLEGTNTQDVPEMPLNRFGIGALTRNTPYAPADLFTGLLDDVQLYTEALDQSQIDFLFANPGNPIPEPTSALLIGFALGTFCLRRRR